MAYRWSRVGSLFGLSAGLGGRPLSPISDHRDSHAPPRSTPGLSQRDYIMQPRVARHELPWGQREKATTLKGLGQIRMQTGDFQLCKTGCGSRLMQLLQSWNPLRGRPSFLATLVYRMQSLRDSFSADGADWSARRFGCGFAALGLCGSMNCIDTAKAAPAEQSAASTPPAAQSWWTASFAVLAVNFFSACADFSCGERCFDWPLARR